MAFTVHGKVQGVWFRAWTRDTAREMGVNGWVRNKSDGTVEGVAVGDDALLDAFLARLHEGPPLARVSGVDVERRDAESPAAAFEVRA